jgi:ubiquinone biosynthesis protein
MLQKTLLNVEGLGRELYPELDLWSEAKPELEAILREKHSIEHAARDLRTRLPAWLSQAPEIPGLVHDYLERAAGGKLVTRISSEDLAALRLEHERAHNRTLQALAASAALLAGTLFTVSHTGPWYVWGYSTPGVVLLGLGAWLFTRALRSG